MEKKRVFSILDFPTRGNKYGKFKGVYPSNAAQKAFHKIAKEINFIDNQDGKKYLVFYIQDIESKKIYKFIGTIIILENPIEINHQNRNIKIHHRILVAKFDKDMEKAFIRK